MAKGKRAKARAERAAQQQRSSSQPRPPSPPVVDGGQIQPPGGAHGGGGGAGNDDGNQEPGEGSRRGRLTRYEKITLWFMGIGLFFSLCLTLTAGVGWWYAHGQLKAMQGQLNEMASQTGAMKAQNDLMQSQIDQAETTIGLTKDALEASRGAADAANKSNEIATAALIAQQRPWIRISAAVPVKPEAKYPLNVGLDMKNSGPTPGTIVEHSTSLNFFEPGVKLKEDGADVGILIEDGINRDATFEQSFLDEIDADAPRGVEPFVVPPNDSVFRGITGGKPLGEKLLADIKNGKKIAVFIAIIRYTDPASEKTGKRHTTWYCGVYNPEKREFARTTKYNHMD